MPTGSQESLFTLAREVEEFVASAGWEQAPQLFAVVPTKDLMIREPDLAGQLDESAEFTPIAQDPLSNADLEEQLAGIVWPEAVSGCALVQEIVILPPTAEDELTAIEQDEQALRQVAAAHPDRREGRLVAAVLRNGETACIMRLRGKDDEQDELLADQQLAPNLTSALLHTFEA